MTAAQPKRTTNGRFRRKPPTEPFTLHGVVWSPSDEWNCPVGHGLAVEVHYAAVAAEAAVSATTTDYSAGDPR